MSALSCFYHALPNRITSPIFTSLRATCGTTRQSYAIYKLANISESHLAKPINLTTFSTRLKHTCSITHKRHHHHIAALHTQTTTALSSQTAPQPGPTTTTELHPGQLHLWWVDPARLLHDSATIDFCSATLTDTERAECLSASSLTARNERLLARGFLRTVLAQYLLPNGSKLDPAALTFSKNAHGKPDMKWPQTTTLGHTLRFNLTHTGGMIGVALTVDALVGLDVEMLGRKTKMDPLKLAARRFSQREVEQLQGHVDKELQALHFMQIWTLKEAYVKALGRGISAPPGLRAFSFSITPTSSAAASQAGPNSCSTIDFTISSGAERGEGEEGEEEQRQWQFMLLQPSSQHIAAVCVERPTTTTSSVVSAGGVKCTSFQGEVLLGRESVAADQVLQTNVMGLGLY